MDGGTINWAEQANRYREALETVGNILGGPVASYIQKPNDEQSAQIAEASRIIQKTLAGRPFHAD